MKLTLFRKFLAIYLILIFIIISLFYTVGVSAIQKHILREKRDNLYYTAQQVCSHYFASYEDEISSHTNILDQFSIMDNFRDIRIWIVNQNGELIADTDNETMTNINIHDLDPTFLEKSYSENTMIGDLFHEPMLSVILPITKQFQRKGYVVLHTPMSSTLPTISYYTTFFSIVLSLICIGILILLIIIYYITIVPLKTVIKATSEYSKGNLGYTFDIYNKDEYQRLSTTIKLMVQELQNLDDYQKNFVANISHDFRSPLTSIKGFAEAMLDGTIEAEQHEKYLEIILFETERLTKLTSNLLTLNSYENKGTLLDLAVFDINKEVKQISASFERICRKKNITLKLSFIDYETPVYADMGKIQQVLYNLIDNAIKFSHSHSSIRIKVEEKNDKIFVSIKDYGIGIPKESMKKIWERFYKTDLSRGKDKKGTGLGLSITKEIIKVHGEHINVVSTPDVGTEFTFTLSKPPTTL